MGDGYNYHRPRMPPLALLFLNQTQQCCHNEVMILGI